MATTKTQPQQALEPGPVKPENGAVKKASPKWQMSFSKDPVGTVMSYGLQAMRYILAAVSIMIAAGFAALFVSDGIFISGTHIVYFTLILVSALAISVGYMFSKAVEVVSGEKKSSSDETQE